MIAAGSRLPLDQLSTAHFVALREPDSAFAWLDRVAEWGPSPMSVLRMDPRLAPIRADPRYRRLLATLGLAAAEADVSAPALERIRKRIPVKGSP